MLSEKSKYFSGTKKRYSQEQIDEENKRFIVKVYAWMSFALIVTGFTAVFISVSPQLIENYVNNRFLFYGTLIFEFIIVIILVGTISKISADTAVLLFIFYAILNGLSLSVIFLVFTTESIYMAFFITAGTFAVMSFWGYFTKSDLTELGNILLMVLIGLVLATFVNFYLQSKELDFITTYVGILLFSGLVAYDTQKIKELNIIGNENSEIDRKEAIVGALTLYLDFINLFLKFLNVFGKRK